MPSKFELLPGEPILLQTMEEDFDYRVDTPRDLEQVISILEAQSHPIFYIMDITRMKLSLDDLIAGASAASQQSQMFRHPNMREAIIVTQSRMMELGARGLSAPIFGGIKLKVLPTLDEALAYARGNAAMRDAI